jgi:signal transduction histidine kinase
MEARGRAAMRRITTRFVLLIASAAVAPLVLYGVISIYNLRSGTEQSVREGNLRVARQVAEQIKQYIVHNQRVLRSIGLELRAAGMQPWQQTRVLRDYALDFPELREISFFTAAGRVIATSRVSAPTLAIPDAADVDEKGMYIAPIQLDNDSLPTTTLAVRIQVKDQETAWVLGELALEELWRMINRVRIGEHGYALLLAEDQRLIAHGDFAKARKIAAGAAGGGRAPEQQFAARVLAEPDHSFEDYASGGQRMLGVGARVPDLPLPWVVIVEQPIGEAFQVATQLQRQLFASIALALLGTVIVGTLWGRSFITRIFALTRATQSIAEGRLEERVAISGRDEIRQLGDAFNSMADRLVELQEDVRRQERQAMFGRIAAGLVHDLSHPIQNIYNSCKLIQKMFDDLDYRDTFKRTVEREMVVVKRVLEDLRNIARPIPLERFPLDVDKSIAEVVDSMIPHAETAGISLRAETGARGMYIEGDLFALGRVYRNLIINAIQATAPGGDVTVSSESTGNRVQIKVSDTGCGIPPDRLAAIFEDFVTTKRRGLGLGLAISKKIVEQLGGQISVTSEVGRGTTFVLDFPRAQAPRMKLVAG